MNLNGNANIPAARVTVEQFTHGGKYPGCYCHTTALGKLTFIIFKITDVRIGLSGVHVEYLNFERRELVVEANMRQIFECKIICCDERYMVSVSPHQ